MLLKKIKHRKKQYLTIFLSVIILLSGVVTIVTALNNDLDKNLKNIEQFYKNTILIDNLDHNKINEENLNILNKRYGSENISITLNNNMDDPNIGPHRRNVTNYATLKNGVYVRGLFDNVRTIDQLEVTYGYLWEENTNANVIILDEETSIRTYGRKNTLGEIFTLVMESGERVDYEVIAIVSETSQKYRDENFCGTGDCNNQNDYYSDLYIPINSYLKYVEEDYNYYYNITQVKIYKENISDEEFNFVFDLLNYPNSDLNKRIYSYNTLSSELIEEFYFSFKLILLISIFIGVLTYLGNAIVKIVNLYDNKKEIFIHKITGATNKDVFKIYLKEIVVLNLIFLLIPVFILATIFNYVYLTLEETKELFNIISIIKYTFLSFSIVMIIDLLIFSIPILKLSKLKLDECRSKGIKKEY